jgi:[ribosomal protein S5]-alanine N-acetyltransferase
MAKILETEHLNLVEFTPDDALFIIELLNSEGWLKYIGERNVKTEEDAIRYLENGPIKSYAVNGFGLYRVTLKEGQLSIGMCGIIKRTDLEHPDIGFALLPQFTGKGYALEIAKATVEYARETLKLKELLGITTTDNNRSIQLLEKIGLTYEKNVVMNGEELMMHRLKVNG